MSTVDEFHNPYVDVVYHTTLARTMILLTPENRHLHNVHFILQKITAARSQGNYIVLD